MIVVAYGFAFDVFRFQLRIMFIVVLWKGLIGFALKHLMFVRQLPTDDNSDDYISMPCDIDPTPDVPSLASDIIDSLISRVPVPVIHYNVQCLFSKISENSHWLRGHDGEHIVSAKVRPD